MTAFELNILQAEFEEYMTQNRWDTCCAEGIYEDDGIRAVSMFVEFCLEGKVTDDDGKELEACGPCVDFEPIGGAE